MSNELVKATEKSGTKISKDKLLDLIKKSPQREFSFSQSPASKVLVVALPS